MNDLNWKSDTKQENDLPKINWDALRAYASCVKSGQYHGNSNEQSELKCEILPIYSMGGRHLVRLLEFSDGTKWVARIQLHQTTPDSQKLLLFEKDTLCVIREQTTIPVPRVLAYEICQEQIGRPFMIMEFIPGSTAMNAFGGPQIHGGEVPLQYKAKFHSDIAKIHTSMASVRFPKIGMISRIDDGSYDISPIPGLGGPFETAHEYFMAWIQNARFSTTTDDIRSQVPPSLADELILSIQQFPSRFGDALEEISLSPGPFPLRHPDFYHSNVIIDKEFNILSIIDWEGASTVPWEAIQFPMFLYTVPRPIDLPSKYNHEGYPISPEVRERWEERQKYVEFVRAAEFHGSHDCKLSTILDSQEVQNLATSIRLYEEEGKVGYYCRLFEKKNGH